MKRITSLLAVFALLLASAAHAQSGIPIYGYKVVHTYPHDTAAYTEGLFYLDGYLYESTGTEGESTIRKLDLATGKVLQKVDLPPPDYGEGIVAWKNRLIQLTWQSQRGYVYDLKSFKRLSQFSYPGEGWALTTDGHRIYMSDGTATIRVLDPETLKQVDKIEITAMG